MAIIGFFIDEWIDFAKKHNGSVERSRTGLNPIGFGMSVWQSVFLKIPFAASEIVIMTGEAAKMEIYFDFKTDIKQTFLIYPEDYMDRIGKFFHLLEDVCVEDEVFDNQYYIKSGEKECIHTVLSEDVKDFLIQNRSYVSNFKLSLKNGSSVLELNAPFNEHNIAHMEKVVLFMKKSIKNILIYLKNTGSGFSNDEKWSVSDEW